MSGPVRITFCITELDPGGAERALVQLVSRLDRSRYELNVICLAEPGELAGTLEGQGVPVHCLHARRWRTLLTLPRLVRLLRRLRPDILHCWLFQANLLGRLAGRLAGVPVIYAGVRVAEKRGRWRAWLERLTHRLATGYVCVSSGVAEQLRNQGIPAGKIHVIPNGVDYKRFAEAAPAELASLGIPPGARVALFVGRLDPQKAPELLLEACLPLFAEFPALYLLLVGEGPLRADLERRVAAAGVGSRVCLAGRRDDVPGLMKAAEFLALPSRWEGMPNVILEAMAAGLPVVATAVEGTRELIQDNWTGRLARVDDLPGLRQAIREALICPDVSSDFAKNAQTLVQQEFSWAIMSRRQELLYETGDTKSVPDFGQPPE